MKEMIWDTHVHLDFIRKPRDVAREAETLGMGLFAMTVTPRDFQAFQPELESAANVRVGAGLHPRWIADGRCGAEDLSLMVELALENRYVGEIGLDASPKHVPEGTLGVQTAAFEKICAACAESSDRNAPKILSIHSVMTAELTLDVLERTGCLENCRCVFHWYTGSNEGLTRAVKAGCMFSVNEMMLGTRRGREYARQIPDRLLLLETDMPPGQDSPYTALTIKQSLEQTLSILQELRGKDMSGIVLENTERLMA